MWSIPPPRKREAPGAGSLSGSCYRARACRVYRQGDGGGSGGQGRRGTRQQAVGGSAHRTPPPVHDKGIDHHGAAISVAQKFLDGADVVAVFQEVRREGMAEGVAREPDVL